MSLRFGMSMSSWIHLQLIGMVVAAAVALWAMVTAQTRKWPAAVVMVFAAPMGQLVGPAFAHLLELVVYFGLPGILMVFGTAVTMISAVVIMIRPPVPPPDDPVARAKVVR